MSQAKVDKYKEYKKNRKEELEKERKAKQRASLIGRIVAIVIAAGLLIALGITAYNAIRSGIQARPDYNREEMILEDVAGVLSTEAPTTEAPTTEAVPEGTTAADTASEPAPSEAETTAAPASN